MTYSLQYNVRWSDVDPNGHMRLSCYSDYGTDVRLRFLSDHGFTPARFSELHLGPVVLVEENRYRREVTLGEPITVTVQAVGMSPEGSRWRIFHEVLKADGVLAATLQLEGGWLDVIRRKLVVPPPDLFQLFDDMERTQGFCKLAPLVKP